MPDEQNSFLRDLVGDMEEDPFEFGSEPLQMSSFMDRLSEPASWRGLLLALTALLLLVLIVVVVA